MPDASLNRSPLARGIVLGACVMGAVVLLIAWLWRAPGDNSAEAGFARDMATHHAQAVDMAFVVRDAATDAALRTLAYDIITVQSAQRGVFMGWLQQWGLPQASTRLRMAWMPGHGPGPSAHDHGGADARMPGMANDDELARLHEATGKAAEVLFLQLMIRHHEGGVLMASAVLGLSRREEVVSMAQSIESGQRVEITLMKEMLAERGARPLSPNVE